MGKLSKKRERERERVNPDQIYVQRKFIARTFPVEVRQFARGRFIVKALKAVNIYLSLLPTGEPRNRKHRTSRAKKNGNAHRPTDAQRHSLIGDLYEAYMTARGDDPDLRGFKKTADSVLRAAALAPLAEHEQTFIRQQIRAAAALLSGS
jgi:hypothetical protein